MFFKKLHNKRLTNNHGFTLIEVLASLALLSVIVVLATNLMITASSNKQVIQGGLTLQQQTNLLVMDIRNTYLGQTGTGDLTFALDSGVTIKQLVINGEEKEPTSPIQNINFDEPFNLNLITENQNHKTITIKTTWNPIIPKQVTTK